MFSIIMYLEPFHGIAYEANARREERYATFESRSARRSLRCVQIMDQLTTQCQTADADSSDSASSNRKTFGHDLIVDPLPAVAGPDGDGRSVLRDGHLVERAEIDSGAVVDVGSTGEWSMPVSTCIRFERCRLTVSIEVLLTLHFALQTGSGPE